MQVDEAVQLTAIKLGVPEYVAPLLADALGTTGRAVAQLLETSECSRLGSVPGICGIWGCPADSLGGQPATRVESCS